MSEINNVSSTPTPLIPTLHPACLQYAYPTRTLSPIFLLFTLLLSLTFRRPFLLAFLFLSALN